MTAQVIHLWGGKWERRMRIPEGRLSRPATVIYLPKLPLPPTTDGRRRRIRLRPLDGAKPSVA